MRLLLTVVAVWFGFASAAQAQLFTTMAEKGIKPYLSVEGGVSLWHVETGGTNTGIAPPQQNSGDSNGDAALIGAHFGVRWERFRFEAGFTDRESFVAETMGVVNLLGVPFNVDSNINVTTGDFSVYYDFVDLGKLKLFGGAGLGISEIEYSGSDGVWSSNKTSHDFFWHVGCGAEYVLTEHLSAIFNYRYVDLGVAETPLQNFPAGGGGDIRTELTGHEFTLGLMITF